MLINTAGIAGWALIGLPDIPDDAFLGENDAIMNNLYGTIYLMSEALRVWKMEKCVVPIGQAPCPSLGYYPSIVNVASEQGLTPTPSMMMYGVSKAGIIQATRTSQARTPSPPCQRRCPRPGRYATHVDQRARGLKQVANSTTRTPICRSISVRQRRQGGQRRLRGRRQESGARDDVDGGPARQVMFAQFNRVDPRKIAETILRAAATLQRHGRNFVVGRQIWKCSSLRAPLRRVSAAVHRTCHFKFCARDKKQYITFIQHNMRALFIRVPSLLQIVSPTYQQSSKMSTSSDAVP